MRSKLLPLVVVAAALLLPAAAHAASLAVSGSTIQYVAASGEENRLTITQSGSNYVFTETGVNVPGSTPIVVDTTSPCQQSQTAAGTATCPSAGIDHLDVQAGDLDDQVTNDTATDSTLDGGTGGEILTGGSGNDTIIGSPSGDDINGRGGNDTIDGGLGSDLMFGGDGIDTIDYSSRTNPVHIDFTDPNPDQGETGEGDVIVGFEVARGGSGNDTFIGGPGDDTFFGGAGNDVAYGGPGRDQLIMGPGDDLMNGGPGGDNLVGGDGFDIVDYTGETQPVNVTLAPSAIPDDGVVGAPLEQKDAINTVGDDSVEGVIGGSGNDVLVGDSGHNFISGGPGNDDITGGPGPDELHGGPGADTIHAVDGFPDTGDCGDGLDTLYADPIDSFGSDCEPAVIHIHVPRVFFVPPRGIIPITLPCPPSAGGGCGGTLLLRTIGDPFRRLGAGARKHVTLAKKRFSIAAGKRGVVKLRISKRTLAKIRRVHKVRAELVVVRPRARFGGLKGPPATKLTLKVRR